MIIWRFALKIFLFGYLFSIITLSTAVKQPAPPWVDMDYRVVFVDELIAQRKAWVFYDTKLQNFTAFIIDSKSRRISVVGDKNSLLRLDGESLGKIRQKDLGQSQIAQIQRTCTSCKLDVYISLMQPLPNMPGLVIVCLSYVFDHNSRFREKDDKPNCEIVHVDRKSDDWEATFESSGFAPYNPLSENTVLAGSNNFLYIGAPITNNGDYRIVKRAYPNFSGKIDSAGNLETPMGDTRYFNGRTDFISSFQTKDAVFFLFREKSKEKEECCKQNSRVTRLARICKSDPGGTGSNHPSRNNFITFQKASLICPMPGQSGFRFSEARSAYWDEQSKVLYAVFSSAENAPAGSAICLFDFVAFNQVFGEPFRGKKGKRLRRKRLNKCPMMWNSHRKRKQRQFASSQYAYTLTARSIHPQRGHATFSRYDERWTHITFDRPPMPSTEKRSIVVLFVATSRGSIMKVAIITPTRSCMVEEYRFRDSDERVNKMRLYDIENRLLNENVRYILMTTNKRVLKLPLHRCHRFKTQTECIEARDPYCGWDPNNEECASFNRDQKEWLQDLSVCPDKRHPSNPRWSQWSAWEPCQNVNSRRSYIKKAAITKPPCQCRYKRCLHPKLCDEEEPGKYKEFHVQVSNCTKDDESGWAPWSAWSPCSTSCGPGTRVRERKCRITNNPYEASRFCPRTQGRQTKNCNQPDCTDSTEMLGSWGPWSRWTRCSNLCGKGFRNRTRTCQPQKTSVCVGDSKEWTECTLDRCQAVKKSSQWTPWLRDDETTSAGYVKKRFQFVCAANVANPNRVQMVKIITEEKFCTDKKSCNPSRRNVHQDGGWSPWSAWSACTKICDTGLQERSRKCDNPYPSGNGKSCLGNEKETRLCNTMPCLTWTCWSEWSSCDETCSQKRTRKCRVDNTYLCAGLREESRSCTGGRCENSIIYWSQWTQWSDCSPQGTRLRERQCNSKKICFGSSREFKSCYYTGTGDKFSSGRFGLIHLVLSTLICFILGGLIAAVVVACAFRACYQRRRRMQRARARSNTYALRETPIPPSRMSTIQRPNNLRIVNDIHSGLPTGHDDLNTTAPLLPPRRYDLPSDSSTIDNPRHHHHHHHSMNISPTSPPPLPPRLNSLPSRQHSMSATYPLHKDTAGLSSL